MCQDQVLNDAMEQGQVLIKIKYLNTVMSRTKALMEINSLLALRRSETKSCLVKYWNAREHRLYSPEKCNGRQREPLNKNQCLDLLKNNANFLFTYPYFNY